MTPRRPPPSAARTTRVSRIPAGPLASDAEMERALLLAFAPVHKHALGVAVGSVAGLLVFAATAVRLLVGPEGRTDLALLSQYFAGYSESWGGAFVGLGWGFVVGFVAGWFAAFVRNLVMAVWLLVVRTRADLAATRDFLDHI
ncbi:MAG TPA: hypothetical protein VGE02_16145 [Gemmatimonadales bacterium]